jgi:cytochrome c556
MRLSKHSKTLTKISLFVALIFGLSACVSTSPSFDATKQHMLESQKLHQLIHELNTVVYNIPKSELQKDEDRRRYALEYAKTIQKVAKNVENLTYNQKGERVSEDDKKLYASFAKRLYKNGKDIQKVVSEYKLEELNAQLIKAETTCNACHSKFRGEL